MVVSWTGSKGTILQCGRISTASPSSPWSTKRENKQSINSTWEGLRIPRSLVFAPSELLLLVSFLFFLFPILCPQFSIILLDWTNYCILFSITFCSAYRSIYLKKQDPGDWTNPTPWFYLECDQNLAAWLLAIGAICRSNEVDQVSTGNQTLEYNKTSGIQNISKTHPFRYTVT